ncbi:HypC/HybG/HupF family hydrogenase formation chaperone [Roseospira visakhapatnamensis]|uniref:Hydrogenase expression/formation protein HypC n=1 Tax=Roseospira visakhapatnamensis TaxID=390880 RepID=A0A7W6REQ5_9PROT|nr:HypC/HybG/HupF family hydrogenase formation chaperone [Roseospira visakhapatnamensis]MBB4267113.1 hydrogenase expression/formation protein HypC [Roseospira visakhapatnamensis]
MCLGLPMRILDIRGAEALCQGRGEVRRVSMVLLDPQPVGAWVLVHLDTARQPLTAEEAATIDRALDALETVARGGAVDHLFADLVDREPELPPHLRPAPS